MEYRKTYIIKIKGNESDLVLEGKFEDCKTSVLINALNSYIKAGFTILEILEVD